MRDGLYSMIHFTLSLADHFAVECLTNELSFNAPFSVQLGRLVVFYLICYLYSIFVGSYL